MKVIVTGGGTGGHINPAIAIAKYFAAHTDGCEILYVGGEYGLEKKLVPAEGFDIKFIDVRGFIRKPTLKNIGIAVKAAKAIGASKKIIKEFSPDIVIGTGGYVCGPVLSAAASMGIPTIIHEQNVFPGTTVKLLAKKVDVVATSFETTKNYLNNHKKIVLTGNPVRSDLLETSPFTARITLKIDQKPLVLMMGGSLGAKSMNDALVEIVTQNLAADYNLIASTGEKNYDAVMEAIGDKKIPDNIKIQPYIYDTGAAFAAAQIIVCRTGAGTISELSAAGKPAIVIPSPNVAHNHQEYNAKYLADRGAAVMIEDSKLTGRLLDETIRRILSDSDKMAQMGKAAKMSAATDATERIYKCAMSLLGLPTEKDAKTAQ